MTFIDTIQTLKTPFATATQAADALVGTLATQFEVDESSIGNSKILRNLPASLRTNHWYCDLHHSMFLILLSRADEAMTNGKRHLCEYFVDTITIYWLIHSLMEEEGMALQISRGTTTEEQAAQHAAAHVAITRWWNANVLTPFKNGTASNLDMRTVLQAFFNRVVKHIETMDQHSYGVHSTLNERDISREVAHIASSGLPLSPFMPGCTSLLQTLAPYMQHELNQHTLAPASHNPLKPLNLTKTTSPMWDGGKGAFRDLFIRQYAPNTRRAA